MSSQFDKEGRYFAQLTEDGKLKIWNTVSSSFEQEYIPDLHLTSPCTCLQFLEPFHHLKNGSPRKKKRKDSISSSFPDLVIGTSSGRLILYSISKGDVDCIIKTELHTPVACLSNNNEETLISGSEGNVIVWDLQHKVITSKWRVGNEKITAILPIFNQNKLLTGSKTIKLWNLSEKTLLKTFKGHSSEVCLLQFIGAKYIISGSQGDRLMNVWNVAEDVSDEHPTVSLLMEDSVKNISLHFSQDGSTKLAASIASGVVHIFHLMLNGKSSKPVKPKSTVQVVSDTGQKKDAIKPIPIVSCFLKNEKSLMICHGSSLVLKFEDVELTNKKIICLLRKLQNLNKKELTTSRDLTPVTENVHYVTPFNNVKNATVKRKSDGTLEVPMEKRLENLTLTKLDEGEVPRSNNMANLLLQGLRSKDPTIIRTVLFKKDEKIIRNTVKRLPLKVISELVAELSKFIQGKTIWSQTGALWMKYLIQTHTALLISNPDLPDLFAPVLNSIENRLNLQTPLNRLKGRLDLLVYQVGANSNEDAKDSDDGAMLIFNDKDSAESDDEEIDLGNMIHSESEDEWSEEDDNESGGDEKMEEDKSDSNDEMSD